MKKMDFTIDLDEFTSMEHLLELPDDLLEKTFNPPTRAYFRNRKAMRATPADVKDLPNATVYTVDMPGMGPDGMKVQVEDGKALVVEGERKRSGEKMEARYVRAERRMGRFMRRFPLPEGADLETVMAECKDGVLTVAVRKKKKDVTKKRQTIEVKVG